MNEKAKKTIFDQISSFFGRLAPILAVMVPLGGWAYLQGQDALFNAVTDATKPLAARVEAK